MNLRLLLKHIQPSRINLPILQRLHKRRLVNNRSPRRIHNHNPLLHSPKLLLANDMPRAGIKREVQTQHIARLQQRLEIDVARPAREVPAQLAAVVILDLHAEGAGALRHGPPDAAHAQNAQDLALGVVAQREGFPAPVAAAYGGQGHVDAAEGAEHQQQGDVGRGVVDGDGRAGDLDPAVVASGHVDVVVAGAVVGDELHARGERGDEFFVEAAGYGR